MRAPRLAGPLLLIALAATPAAAQRRVPDLSGTWRLRDSAAAAAARDQAPGGERDTTTVIDTIPVGGGGRMYVRRPLEPDSRRLRLLQGMAQPVPSFTLELTDSTLTVVNEDGFTYTVFLDGRKTTLPLNDSVSVEAKAKWDDRALVIEYRPSTGGRLTESYFLADSGLYLRLEVRIDQTSIRQPIWQARMYRRVADGS